MIAIALAPAVVARLISLAAVLLVIAAIGTAVDTAPAVERGGGWRRQRPPAASDPAA